MGNDGKFPVDLVIYVKDSWNIIAFPVPQYSTNTGFSIILKGRDYNFFGTMSPFRIDLGYHYNEHSQHFFSLLFDFDIPFIAFGKYWIFDFDHFFEYKPHFSSPLFYMNTTGLSVQLPLAELTYIPGFSVTFNNGLPEWPHSTDSIGHFLSFSHSLSFDRINWIDNFRRGSHISIGNSFGYNFFLIIQRAYSHGVPV
jgi:hypothetical protein